jgi:hypothetical protein
VQGGKKWIQEPLVKIHQGLKSQSKAVKGIALELLALRMVMGAYNVILSLVAYGLLDREISRRTTVSLRRCRWLG